MGATGVCVKHVLIKSDIQLCSLPAYGAVCIANERGRAYGVERDHRPRRRD